MNIQNEKQWQFLKNAIANNKVPQAMIFSGPKGLGKKQVALEFIKLVANSRFYEQDLIRIAPEDKDIQIDQIRDLQKQLNFRPQFTDLRTVIIEQAHTMNKLAQNCFLKTLEEPKGKTIFILLTAWPKMLLPTVCSRCAVLKFFPSEEIKLESDVAQEIKTLLDQDLIAKFAFAEKLSKQNSSSVQTFFENLIRYLRNLLLDNLEQSRGVANKIKTSQSLQYVLQTTNINKRLLLENLFLNI